MPEGSQTENNQPQTSQKINWKFISIVSAVAILLIGGGVAVWLLLSQPVTQPPIQTKTSAPSAKTSTTSSQVDETAGWETFTAATKDFKFDYPPTLFYSTDGGEGVYYGGSFVSNELEAESGNNCEGERICFLLGFQSWRYGLIADKNNPYYMPVPDPSTTNWGEINDLSIGGSTTERIGSVSEKHTRRDDFRSNDLVWLRYDSEIKNHPESQYGLKYSHKLHTKIGNYYYEFAISSDLESVVTQNKKLLEKIVSTFKFLD